MLDIDRFKDYNDAYGHLAGDEALLQLVALLRESVRAVDLVARYGGEEFVIVLPEADQRGAQITAEKIRAAIAAHDFPRGRLTASLGVAQCSDVVGAKMTPEKLIAGADKALFKAKEAGRNRVVVMHD